MVIAAGSVALRSTRESEPALGVSLPRHHTTASRHAAAARDCGESASQYTGTSSAFGRSASGSERIAVASRPTRSSADPSANGSAERRSSHFAQRFSPMSREALPLSLPVAQSDRPDFKLQVSAVSVPDSTPATPPAVMVDIDDPAVSMPGAKERLAAIASDFSDILARSGMDPGTPAYRQLWDREAAIADARFRAMYGGHVWISHHIQSHHAQTSSPKP